MQYSIYPLVICVQMILLWEYDYGSLSSHGREIGIKVADRRGINAIYALRPEVTSFSTSAIHIIKYCI